MELSKLIEHFSALYGRRNRMYLPNLRGRVDILMIAVGDLQKAVRKEMGKVTCEKALARCVSRTFCIVEHFRELPFVEVVSRKYPSGHCSYCGNLPCDCTERRNASKPAENADPAQLQWSLGEWQQHFARAYGEKNRARGLENTINRLFKEVSEVLSLYMEIKEMHTDDSLEDAERKFASELSDVFAWTIAAAAILEIDLENAVLLRYGDGCIACKTRFPCTCTHFDVRPKRWNTADGRPT
jgi:NTP pyrophosphatase (non-canonical NTP hydrolase)